MKFSIKDFFSKCDQIRGFLQTWSHLLKKFLMENFFCAVARKYGPEKNILFTLCIVPQKILFFL